MKKINAQVEMVTPEGGEVKMMFTQHIDSMGSLGKEIKISPKSHMTKNNPGFKAEYFVPTMSVLIGIGNDHTAELIMTEDAHKALIAGAEINITTAKEWKKRYL